MLYNISKLQYCICSNVKSICNIDVCFTCTTDRILPVDMIDSSIVVENLKKKY